MAKVLERMPSMRAWNWRLWLGGGTLALIALVALTASWLAPHDPWALLGPPLAPPGREFWLGTDMLGMAARDILFVSSNGWDICGASWFGYKTFWVNRADAPMEELGVMPSGQARLLSDLPAFIDADARRSATR